MATTSIRPMLLLADDRRSSLRHLVESAVRKVASERIGAQPRSRREWIESLSEALMSESETSHKSVLRAMVANGIAQQEIIQSYVPEVARHIGEMWVDDSASFVDVTVSVGRLQRLYRNYGRATEANWSGRTVPLGQSVLMVVAPFEEHSLGAFAAADQLRRHGLWVHMAIGMGSRELAEVIQSGPFSMVGLSLSTVETVDKASRLIDFIRRKVPDVPPIVIGGRAVEVLNRVAERTGADYAVKSAREAITKCGLATVSSPLAEMASERG